MSYSTSSAVSYWLLVLFVSVTLTSSAQDIPPKLTARLISDPITLDGVLDEAVWQDASSTSPFWQTFPTDSIRAEQATEVRVLYSNTHLYFAITAMATGQDYVVSTLKRDYRGSTNDNVNIMLDTFNDGNNAFVFGVTPYGVRREVLVSDGGSSVAGFNPTWDVKWKAESKIYDDKYIVEMAIPLYSLKFKEGDQQWRFQAYRFNLQTNEQSTWARVPQNQILINLAFMGTLEFEQPLGKSKTPFALIPYINTLTDKDFDLNLTDRQLKMGGDAKVAIGNGMNLDITVNPDFSNVEVDNLITNLTRFEVSLPEKRQFFIDNNDLFGSFGSRRDAVPFFSRRIGIAEDTAGNTISNDILGGVRLSGKLDQNWRLGFLNLQTAEDSRNEIASTNNAMFAIQRKLFSRSNVGFFMVNRQTFGNQEFQEPEDEYNRVLGLDYNLASQDGVWSGKAFVHRSFQPDDHKGNLSSQASLTYNTRNWRFSTNWVYVDEDFRSDLGFVPRKDILKSVASARRTFYPEESIINKHSFQVFNLLFWRPGIDMQQSDQTVRIGWEAEFKDRSNLELQYRHQYIYLTDTFDPTRTDDATPLDANRGYTFNQIGLEYESNQARALTSTTEFRSGGFFNGHRTSVESRIALRIQPRAQITFSGNYDRIRLPDPYPDADIWLLSPKAEFTFSKNLFWSTLAQYSSQREDLGINSRLQWRFSQLSDIFLVYNDNYYSNPWQPRYKSLNLKATYWFNK